MTGVSWESLKISDPCPHTECECKGTVEVAEAPTRTGYKICCSILPLEHWQTIYYDQYFLLRGDGLQKGIG
ncbi:hypothetical protein K8R42_00355 [bacterium]|nr:hypothetical protein [bacterium]